MTEEDSGSIQRALGQLEGTVAALGDKVDDLGKRSEAGRARIYERIEQSDKTTAEIAAVAREAARLINETRDLINTDVMPTIKEVKKWKISGMTIIAIVGIGGTALGAIALWAWDVIVQKFAP